MFGCSFWSWVFCLRCNWEVTGWRILRQDTAGLVPRTASTGLRNVGLSKALPFSGLEFSHLHMVPLFVIIFLLWSPENITNFVSVIEDSQLLHVCECCVRRKVKRNFTVKTKQPAVCPTSFLLLHYCVQRYQADNKDKAGSTDPICC